MAHKTHSQKAIFVFSSLQWRFMRSNVIKQRQELAVALFAYLFQSYTENTEMASLNNFDIKWQVEVMAFLHAAKPYDHNERFTL